MKFADYIAPSKIQPTTCFKKLLPTAKLFELRANCFRNYIVGMGRVGEISKNLVYDVHFNFSKIEAMESASGYGGD